MPETPVCTAKVGEDISKVGSSFLAFDFNSFLNMVYVFSEELIGVKFYVCTTPVILAPDFT